jgi:outer membrane translocation and assembly module TamA
VGPVRLDVGYRLNRLDAGELRPGDRFSYHLSLGQAF